MDIPVNNTVVNRINAIGVWLWYFVLFARFANISGLSWLILIYVVGVSVYIVLYYIGVVGLASEKPDKTGLIASYSLLVELGSYCSNRI